MRLQKTPRFVAALMLGVALFSAAVAQASTLEIQFTGLNLQYDGTNIYDAGVQNTLGSGNPAEADALTSMSLYLDGTLAGTLSSNIFADIYIKDVLNIPATGGVVTTGGNGGDFGIDLLTQNQTPGWGLALNIDTMRFFYTGSKIAISVAGFASDLVTQDLPFGLAFDPGQPITIVLSSANLSNVTSAGGFLTGFNSAGTGNVAGSLFVDIPEPSTYVLAAIGVAGLLQFRRRRSGRSGR